MEPQHRAATPRQSISSVRICWIEGHTSRAVLAADGGRADRSQNGWQAADDGCELAGDQRFVRRDRDERADARRTERSDDGIDRFERAVDPARRAADPA